jgi:hypothetical protein
MDSMAFLLTSRIPNEWKLMNFPKIGLVNLFGYTMKRRYKIILLER